MRRLLPTLLLGLTLTSADAQSLPGIGPDAGVVPATRDRLDAAYRERAGHYTPRTVLRHANGEPRFINRLILDDSPYLLQHAHNPVNWYPWGDEAFETARREQKPVFLSIGYATCHWCHVMAEESFDNERIAAILNRDFIAIKVDREQLPAVDATYMTAAQMLTGTGGWPLSVFLNADAKPFYTLTYQPPEAFTDTLQRVTRVWHERRDALELEADRVAQALASVNALARSGSALGENALDEALRQMMADYDDLQGGFGSAPKFPRTPTLQFLLQQGQRLGRPDLLDAAYFTLQRIAAGGIHDHVGGGFHRYAVDPDWQIPHFEKMLYDQATLALSYTAAWQSSGDTEFAEVARRTLDAALRDLGTHDGLFHAASDAGTGDGEGVYFTWTVDEVRKALDDSAADLALRLWQIDEDGDLDGRNVLHRSGPYSEIVSTGTLDGSRAEGRLSTPGTVGELSAAVDRLANALFEYRQQRTAPAIDSKVITAWNALMISALAQAGAALDDARYRDAAKRAADVLIEGALRQDGTLWRTRVGTDWSISASQADYAALADALLMVFDNSGDKRYLRSAIALVDTMNNDFLDAEHGGYFLDRSTVAGAALPMRHRDLHDLAIPSGNAMAARVLVGFWHRTGEASYRQQAQALFTALSDTVSKNLAASPALLAAVSDLEFGTVATTAYAGRGKVRLATKIDDSGTGFDIVVDIDPGWHINAHRPLQDYLIGTRLTDTDGSVIDGIDYPVAEEVILGFQRSALAVYQGTVRIRLPRASIDKQHSAIPASVAIDIQACSDVICLAPETVRLQLPPATDRSPR